ncbi:MAG: protein kinase [Pseudomonadota bacterium]|nr:protein kinase [Pseudomonadota bacterium]
MSESGKPEDDEATDPGIGSGQSPQPDEDDERTVFRAPAPEGTGETPDETASEDEPVTAPPVVPDEDDDETVFNAPLPEAGADAGEAPATPAPEEGGEETVFQPASPAPAPVDPADDAGEATVFQTPDTDAAPADAHTPPEPPVSDATVTQTTPPAGTQPPVEDWSDATGQTGAVPIAPTAVPRPTRPNIDQPDRPPVHLTVGTTINNNYEITDVIKSGGMGEVFRGKEIATGDPVAIKSILPALAEDETVGQMFKREARTLRLLSDDAIVRYYNYVHDRELDRYFLVMEFIEGIPLSDYIKQHGAIPVPAVQKMLDRLAKGLESAHQKGAFHRDLSPDNVMLPDGDVGEARLIDFGIAKSNVETGATTLGTVAGKMKYMAPEQLLQYGGKIGPQTDIYSLALVTVAAATGTPINMGANTEEALAARQGVPDLSHVPDALRPILMHMLEPDPAHRPPSMAEVRRMLENPRLIPARYLSGMPMPPAINLTGGGIGGYTPVPTGPISAPGLQVPTAGFGNTTGVGGEAPVTAPPAKKGGAGKVLVVLLLIAVLVGGGGWWYLNQPVDVVDVPEAEPDVPESALLPRDGSREAFLAALDTGPCTFVTRIDSGPNVGLLEAFTGTGASFDGLPTAYEEAFGSRPGVLVREVTADQCPALDFARALQGRPGPSISMFLRADAVTSGNAVQGQLRMGGDYAIWSALVAPSGQMFNVTERLSAPAGGTRSLNFGVGGLGQGADPVPQLIVTLAVDRPLTSTAGARDQDMAADVLPRVLTELETRGEGVAGRVNWFELTPPEPAPTPEAEIEAEPVPEGEAQ